MFSSKESAAQERYTKQESNMTNKVAKALNLYQQQLDEQYIKTQGVENIFDDSDLMEKTTYHKDGTESQEIRKASEVLKNDIEREYDDKYNRDILALYDTMSSEEKDLFDKAARLQEQYQPELSEEEIERIKENGLHEAVSIARDIEDQDGGFLRSINRVRENLAKISKSSRQESASKNFQVIAEDERFEIDARSTDIGSNS